MTAAHFAEQALRLGRPWRYDVVTIGFPGLVLHGKPAAEPGNLGSGWVDYDFRKAFDRPVKILNDAVMQALGSYKGGRMLFLGLGTGVGSTLVVDGMLFELELGNLRYSRSRTLHQVLRKAALDRLQKRERSKLVGDIALNLGRAFIADHVVIGGGAAEYISDLPKGVRRGSNRNARIGGFRIWDYNSQRPVITKHAVVLV